MTLDVYTRVFKACIEVCEAVGSSIVISEPSTELVCIAASKDYNAMKTYINGVDIIIFKRMEASGRALYFAALHFEGLNHTRYGTL